MIYKVVRYPNGQVVYGPNLAEYQPVITSGAVVTFEASAPPQTIAIRAAETSASAKLKLTEIDALSISSIREYITAKADAPEILKTYEAAAAIERAKIKP